ncbi:MAG: hypothetical protein JWP87_6368, partial [Labilithrix sp.]|nr:hypothetical protein [Labilithrix sp.]
DAEAAEAADRAAKAPAADEMEAEIQA